MWKIPAQFHLCRKSELYERLRVNIPMVSNTRQWALRHRGELTFCPASYDGARYKSEGRGFDSCWGYWNFLLT